MRGCIGFFLFLFIVGPLLFAFEVTAATSTWLFNRDFYSDVLAAPEIYSALLQGVLSEAGGAVGELGDSAEFERIATELNSEEWRAAVESAISQTFDVIEGRATSITIDIPLSPLRALLQSSVSEDFIRQYAENIPACRPGQEPTVATDGASQLPLPVCIPGNVTRAEFVNDLVEDLPAITANMPDRFTYTIDAIDTEQFQEFGAFGVQNAIVSVVAALACIGLGSWFFTGMIAAGTAGGKLRWLGGMLVLPSLVVLLIGVGMSGLLAEGLRDSFFAAGNDLPDALSRTMYDALAGGVGRIGTSFLAAGGIPTAIGVFLFLVGLIIPSGRRDETMRDLYANPTTQFTPKPKNDFEVFNKPKSDGKVKNDDDIIRPL